MALLRNNSIKVSILFWGYFSSFLQPLAAETVTLKSISKPPLQRGKWVPSSTSSPDWKRVSSSGITRKETGWFPTGQTTQKGWELREISGYYPPNAYKPYMTTDEYYEALSYGRVSPNALEKAILPPEELTSPPSSTKKWIRTNQIRRSCGRYRTLLTGNNYEWNWGTQINVTYALYQYETRDISASLGMQLRVPLDPAVDPKRVSVSYTSGHLMFKDSNGAVLSYHPSLVEIQRDALIFSIPVDPNQGTVLEYPEITYHVVEK